MKLSINEREMTEKSEFLILKCTGSLTGLDLTFPTEAHLELCFALVADQPPDVAPMFWSLLSAASRLSFQLSLAKKLVGWW